MLIIKPRQTSNAHKYSNNCFRLPLCMMHVHPNYSRNLPESAFKSSDSKQHQININLANMLNESSFNKMQWKYSMTNSQLSLINSSNKLTRSFSSGETVFPPSFSVFNLRLQASHYKKIANLFKGKFSISNKLIFVYISFIIKIWCANNVCLKEAWWSLEYPNDLP